jgi:peptidyl-prolyl cis-trans isomerase D
MGVLADGSFVWVEVGEVTESRTPPLEEVRARLIASWKEEEREAALLRLAADLAARVNGGESLRSVADEFGRTPLETPALQRGMSNETFSRIAVNNLFSIGEGEATYGPVGFGNSVVLLQVADIISGEEGQTQDALAGFRQQINQTVSGDLMYQYVNAVRQDLDARVNPQAVAYVIGGDEGTGGY